MTTALNSRARRVAAVSAALIAALILAPAATSAHAAPATRIAAMPTGPFNIEITKLEQPDAIGQPANGLPITDPTTISPPVFGATFSAWRVPGIDVTTNAGQQQAGALTPTGAAALVDTNTTPDTQDTTDLDGDATLGGLAAGLYYVVETTVPVGFVGSSPFLVALPLTHPVTHDSWLSTVHVYPKNAHVSIALDVFDANAVSLGDLVSWASISGIPGITGLDGYRVVQRIDPKLRLLSATSDDITVSIDAPGAPALLLGTHYTLTIDPVTQQITVDFLPAGRATLSQYAQQHPGAKMRIGYRTEVLGEGSLVNEALLYPSRAAIDGGPGAPQPLAANATTKWGPVGVLVHERGDAANVIQGVTFKVYLSEADALSGTGAIEISGVSEWASNAQGLLEIPGLRFSGFADGLDRDPSDPLFRYYYVMPTSFPTGWIGEKTPMRTTVFSTVEVNLLEVIVWRAGGGGDLPVTGTQMAGAAVLGVMLLGVGALFFVRRRKDREDETAQTGV